jgi:hypothetical protein
MGERLVELADQVATPQDISGSEIIYPKTLCTGFSCGGRSRGPLPPDRVAPHVATLLRLV